MTRPFLPSLGRPAAWMVTVAMSAALLAVPVSQSVDAATPKCFGKAATIVGTNGRDIIKGTRRADVIVAKGGKDTIVGRGGNDLICAGGGNDIIRAGAGRDKVSGGGGNDVMTGGYGLDRLLGLAGADVINGGGGNDIINGGAGIDVCQQDAGIGIVRNCEGDETPQPPAPPEPPAPPVATSDLAVSVSSPRRVKSGDITFTVKVTSRGPDAASYSLKLAQNSRKAACEAPQWAGVSVFDELAPGAPRVTRYVASCRKQHNGASVQVKATVSVDGLDPLSDNNAASAKTKL